MEVWFIFKLLFTVCLPFIVSSNAGCDFPCDTGNQCVERSKWCDKVQDCKDGSDEFYCKKSSWWVGVDPNDCNEKEDTHILCGSGICIPIAAKCDGQNDCDDDYDEEHCEQDKNASENSIVKSNIAEPTALDFKFEDEYASKETTTITLTPVSSLSTSNVTRYFKGNYPPLTTTTSHTRDNYSSQFNYYFPSSTSYYDGRMKEVDFTTQPPLTFPKTVPTRPHLANRTISTTTRKLPVNFTRPDSSTTIPFVLERLSPINRQRPQSTHQPMHGSHQSQFTNQHSSHHRPSTNHFRLFTNQYQTSNRHQLPSNYYQPSPNYNQPSTHHHPHSNRPQQPLNYHQPSPNYYQSSPTHHQPYSNSPQRPSNPFQPHTTYQHPPSYVNYNDHRLLNGEPEFQHQTNYFKPYSAEPNRNKYFYFAKDYAAIYGKSNAQFVSKGVEWLLRQRSETADWGRDTPRAIIALALANNSFLDGNNEDEIIKRQFMIQLGLDLLRNNTENFSMNRLAMAINGLLAVCEDPTDFHGIDLIKMLRYKLKESTRRNSYVNPFVFLSLCLSNESLSSLELQNLMKQMTHSMNANERAKDMQIAAVMAFSCYVHQSTSEDSRYHSSLRSVIRDAISRLLEQVGEDGNFGSVYSTALAAQALMSTNESSHWDEEKTMSFLKMQQQENGSFGDLLATYFVLPTLSGRTFLHLRNINCTHPVKRELTPAEILEWTGPKQYVHYSLYFGYPLVNSLSQYLLVPKGINFMDLMRVAQYQDQNFKFNLENNSSRVYSLSDLPNDPEMGLSWHLYVKSESSPYTLEIDIKERFTGDVRSLSPKSGDHFIFWYHTNELHT